MDTIVSAALSEICSQGTLGVSVNDLWPRLQPHLSSAGLDLCDGVKKFIWSRLVNIAGLQFKSKKSSFSPQDTSILSFKDAEKLTLNIVAAEHLSDCFVGLYDIKAGDTGISAPQRRVLERLAVARTDGITQHQLAKEFGIKGNNMYYVVRNLEVCGLIKRQPTIIRTKEKAAEEENTSIVNTNLIHLYRYTKNLHSLQKVEITKFDKLESIGGGTWTSDVCTVGVKDDVLVKDYVPAMKAICDKLEEADGKVLVVSDIKQALSYRKTQGHRAWRNICNRLLDAHLVEEFCGEVNKKAVPCLRLIKKFDLQYVQAKHMGVSSQDIDMEHPVNIGKQGRTSSQLLELPIEHQIYDLIDAEGSKGMTVIEVCKRLGLDNKRIYGRILNMITRMGMHLQAENHNRCVQYRVWTSGNFPEDILHGKPENWHPHQKVDQTVLLMESSTSQDEFRSPGKIECGQKELELGCSFHGADENNQMLICQGNQHDAVNGNLDTDFKEDHESPISSSAEIPLPTSSIPSQHRSYPRHPCLVLTAESAQREQRILERLQEEKFVLIAELLRWLESLEKDKHTSLDKKTVLRILVKLEQEGVCRCIDVSVPLVTNFGRSRTTKVVLHNSLESSSPELMIKIQERLRSFDMQSRGQGLPRFKNDGAMPVLTNIDRAESRDRSDSQAETMRVNGFVLARMVRAKLLHIFLWSYLSSSPDWSDTGRHGYDLKNPHSTCKVLTLAVAVKAMPVELFLQVAGSTQSFDNLVEKCKLGLCLADLPLHQYSCLMDVQATKRLSSLVDILCRLKLMRLVTEKHVEDRDEPSPAIFTYAMELKPYIEEPLSKVLAPWGISSLDLRPRIRHDFILSNRDALDIYWKTLEYCYVAADPKAAVHAFPGSSVHELFLNRSWASVRVMTADQRNELLKRIVRDDPDKRISLSDCLKIAKDLNLTMEQVLRVCNDKRQSRLSRYQNSLNPSTSGVMPVSRKRKRSKTACLKRVQPEEQGFCTSDQEYHNISFRACDEDVEERTVDDQALTEDCREDDFSFIRHCTGSRLKPSRRPKFLWSETYERQLLIQYVKYNAARGVRVHRTNWASIPDLPASPDTCRRKMQELKASPMVSTAIMRLCTLLGDRYAQHMAKSQQKELLNHNISGDILDSNLKVQQWDDFEDANIRVALNEVLRCKRMAKLKDSREEHWQDEGEDYSRRHRRSTCHRLPGKFLKLLSEGIIVSRRAYESLAVANAVELLKLVFLSTSSAPEVANLLAETLRRYSEHELFAAFNYLRDKRFMVGGNGSQPFVLSQQFLHNVASSPFPTNTGKRAAKFVDWLREREGDLMEDTVCLNEDLQCGDIFHLLALVSSGELLISPSLPDEGVGENCENNNNNVKRQRDTDDGEVVCRRAKGFPGIKVSVNRTTILQADAVEWYPHGNSRAATDTDVSNSSDLGTIGCMAAPLETWVDESTWQAMTSYGNQLWETSSTKEQLSPFDPELFKTAYSSIHEAGDQGLSLKQISLVLALQGKEIIECTIDVLQVFGVAVKVNAYDDVRIVDASFCHKYFLTTIGGLKPIKYSNEIDHRDVSLDDVHKVSLLNLPEDQVPTCNEDSMRSFRPILPWINGDGTINPIVYKGLVRRVLGIVMQNPGILEDDVLYRMDVLNPQSCRKLLELMILDNHLIVRKMNQSVCSGPPSILGSICSNASNLICREHLFANPMSTAQL